MSGLNPILHLRIARPWSYFELRRLPRSGTIQTMTAASAEENSLSSKRSWNLKAELSPICLNAGVGGDWRPVASAPSAALVFVLPLRPVRASPRSAPAAARPVAGSQVAG